MKVILAKKAGFCMGVRRAVETTLEIVRKEEKNIVTYGPLIHNPQVLDILKAKGVSSYNEIPSEHKGTIIIRAHGVPPEIKQALEKSGAVVKDATCPRVVKVQVIIKKYREQGYTTIIVGDRDHAEVVGLMGYAGQHCHVVNCEKDIECLTLDAPYIIVSQTTQDKAAFEKLSNLLIEKFPEGRIFNTICDSTHKRQDEIRRLVPNVDALVVVGGKNSANTQRLGEIALQMGCPVFMAETEDDLNLVDLKKFNRIGVTAGASTPTWMINRVIRAIESIPGADEGVFRLAFYKMLRFMLATNLYVSLGGGLLALTGCLLQDITPLRDYFFIAFGYLFAMHNFNRFGEEGDKKFNDPIREKFNKKYRFPLLALASTGLFAALTLTYLQNRTAFYLLLIMSIFGILYQVRIIPAVVSRLTKIRGLKEIPGSKTFLVALAWAFITILIPAIIASDTELVLLNFAGGAFVFVALLVFVRNALFDVFDVQGDRIVGRETFPVVFGEKKTIKILYYLMVLQTLLIILLPMIGYMTTTGFWMIGVIVYQYFLTYQYDKKIFTQGPKLEFALESVFVFAAVLGLMAAL